MHLLLFLIGKYQKMFFLLLHFYSFSFRNILCILTSISTAKSCSDFQFIFHSFLSTYVLVLSLLSVCCRCYSCAILMLATIVITIVFVVIFMLSWRYKILIGAFSDTFACRHPPAPPTDTPLSVQHATRHLLSNEEPKQLYQQELPWNKHTRGEEEE